LNELDLRKDYTIIENEVVSNGLWKNRTPFLDWGRLYFTYGNPVKAEFNGLSARPWQGSRRKILVAQAKERGGKG